MLKERILSTLKFFDLQDYPLTLLELEKFLIAEDLDLKNSLNTDWEIFREQKISVPRRVFAGEILHCLETELKEEAENCLGFYFLPGRRALANARQESFLYGIKREKLIKRFVFGLRHLPFLRGVALGGSQALGPQKPGSDIDLFIVTDENFMWLARTFVTVYFQLRGVRRHGKKIANRFCLNHYVRGAKELTQYRNLYTAMEYGRHRPLVYPQNIAKFHQKNAWWMQELFPNLNFEQFEFQEQSKVQIFLEKIFVGSFGRRLEFFLRKLQESRIRKEQFIIVENDELSFHPESKQKQLLQKFFTS